MKTSKFKSKEEYLAWKKENQNKDSSNNENTSNKNASPAENSKKLSNKIWVVFIVGFAVVTVFLLAPKIKINVEIQADEKNNTKQEQVGINESIESELIKEDASPLDTTQEIETISDLPPSTKTHINPTKAIPVAPPDSPSLNEVISQAKKGVVKIFTPTGFGSGFIISSDGIIVTNAHVVEKYSEVEVEMHSREKYFGEVIKKGIGPLDLAIVKIRIVGYRDYLSLANDYSCTVGDDALVIGNPRTVEYTVTKGIISNCNMIKTNGPKEITYIQTDAAINPGNSGGPLINNKGVVQAINTFILTSGGGSEGLGFSISIDVIKQFMSNQLDYLLIRLEEEEKERLVNLGEEVYQLLLQTWDNEFITCEKNVIEIINPRIIYESSIGRGRNWQGTFYMAMKKEKGVAIDKALDLTDNIKDGNISGEFALSEFKKWANECSLRVVSSFNF